MEAWLCTIYLLRSHGCWATYLILQQLKWHPKYCTQFTCWICMEGFLNKRIVLQRACTMPGQLDILAMMEQMPKRWETRKSSNSIATALQRNKWDQKKTLEQMKTYAKGNAVESPWNLTTDYSFWEPLHKNSTVAAEDKLLQAVESPWTPTTYNPFLFWRMNPQWFYTMLQRTNYCKLYRSGRLYWKTWCPRNWLNLQKLNLFRCNTQSERRENI